MIMLFLVTLCNFIMFYIFIQSIVITLVSMVTKHASTNMKRPWSGSIFFTVSSVPPLN